MTDSSIRIVGLVALVVGLIFTMTGIGAIIGLPLMLIGAIMFLPELFVALCILFVLVVLLLMI